jgi:hypothetical protein
VAVAISANRALPRVARIVADRLGQHVNDYLKRVRAINQPDTKRKKATPR